MRSFRINSRQNSLEQFVWWTLFAFLGKAGEMLLPTLDAGAHIGIGIQPLLNLLPRLTARETEHILGS